MQIWYVELFCFFNRCETNKFQEVELKNEFAEGKPSGEFAWKQVFTQEQKKFTVNGKLDTKGAFEAKGEAEGFVDGLTLSSTGKLYTEKPTGKDADNDNVSVETKYKHKHATVSGLAKKVVGKPFQVTGSFVAAHSGIHVGAQAQLSLYPQAEKADQAEAGKLFNLDKYEVGLRYDLERFSFSAAYIAEKEVKFGAVHKARDDLSVGAEFKSKLDTGSYIFTTAVAKNLNADSSVNASFSCLDGVTTVAYKVKLNKDVESTFNVQTNLYKLDATKLGASFVFSPAKKD